MTAHERLKELVNELITLFQETAELVNALQAGNADLLRRVEALEEKQKNG